MSRKESPPGFQRKVKISKWLFDSYIFGNVHIGLCQVALAETTQAMFQLQLRQELLVFIFCATLFGYNLQRLPSALGSRGVHRGAQRHQWNREHRGLLTVLSILAAIALA